MFITGKMEPMSSFVMVGRLAPGELVENGIHLVLDFLGREILVLADLELHHDDGGALDGIRGDGIQLGQGGDLVFDFLGHLLSMTRGPLRDR